MIVDRTLQYLGQQYVWSYDPAITSPRSCWWWARADHFAPSPSLSDTLSAALLKEQLHSFIVQLEYGEYQRFAGILRWMGCPADRINLIQGEGLCPEKVAALSGFVSIHWQLTGNNGHHRVYVIELNATVRRVSRVMQANPNSNSTMPCVYVGLTGLKAEERFQKHLAGEKASWYAKEFGVRLLPELSDGLYGMPYNEAIVVESALAVELRRQGYVVTGGH